MGHDLDVARNLLAKVRNFVSTELDEEESQMFASLLTPGVALAYKVSSEDEVSGFSGTAADPDESPYVEWSPESLPDALGQALHESGARIVGLGFPEG
jgi:hypothetical protein